MSPPRLAQPFDPGDRDTEFRLDGAELFMHDHFTQEVINAAGTDCRIFQLDPAKAKVDTVYGEPTANGWGDPIILRGHIEWPESTPEAGEEGMRMLWPSAVWIPRKSLEEAGGKPIEEGDIVHFWHLPFFDDESTRRVKTTNQGYFFDVIKVNDDGHLHDAPQFIAFRCDLKRRSNAPPELNFDIEKTPDDDC